MAWGTGDFALLYEAEWKARRSITWVIAPDAPDAASSKALLFDRNYEARGGGAAVLWGCCTEGLLWGLLLLLRRHLPPAAASTASLTPCPPPALPPALARSTRPQDAYSDPGSPASRRTQWGTYVLALVGGERKLLMQGSGASPEGNRCARGASGAVQVPPLARRSGLPAHLFSPLPFLLPPPYPHPHPP